MKPRTLIQIAEAQAAATKAITVLLNHDRYRWAYDTSARIARILRRLGCDAEFVREKHHHGDVIVRHALLKEDKIIIRAFPAYSGSTVEGHSCVLPPERLSRWLRVHAGVGVGSHNWINLTADLRNLPQIIKSIFTAAILHP